MKPTIHPDSEVSLIKALRHDAEQVKECFTRFSFHSISFSAAILALMFATIKDYPQVALGSIPLVALLMATSRIGMTKYTTANRNYGYELHLARTSNYFPPTRQLDLYQDPPNGPAWKEAMREIEWEEAVRAWRVVQSTLFKSIYTTPDGSRFARLCGRTTLLRWINDLSPFQFRLKPPARRLVQKYKRRASHERNGGYPWFMPSLMASDAHAHTEGPSYYYAGSYLTTMLRILTLMQYLALLPIVVVILKSAQWDWGNIGRGRCPVNYANLISEDTLPWLALALALLVLIKLRSLRAERRCDILENELLSIHSCAITWQAVILAHHAALDRCKESGGPYRHYTRHLVREARSLRCDAFRIHEWIDGYRS